MVRLFTDPGGEKRRLIIASQSPSIHFQMKESFDFSFPSTPPETQTIPLQLRHLEVYLIDQPILTPAPSSRLQENPLFSTLPISFKAKEEKRISEHPLAQHGSQLSPRPQTP